MDANEADATKTLLFTMNGQNGQRTTNNVTCASGFAANLPAVGVTPGNSEWQYATAGCRSSIGVDRLPGDPDEGAVCLPASGSIYYPASFLWGAEGECDRRSLVIGRRRRGHLRRTVSTLSITRDPKPTLALRTPVFDVAPPCSQLADAPAKLKWFDADWAPNGTLGPWYKSPWFVFYEIDAGGVTRKNYDD